MDSKIINRIAIGNERISRHEKSMSAYSPNILSLSAMGRPFEAE